MPTRITVSVDIDSEPGTYAVERAGDKLYDFASAIGENPRIRSEMPIAKIGEGDE